MTERERIEGLININTPEEIKGLITRAAEDLIEDGFGPLEITRYFEGLIDEAVTSLAESLKNEPEQDKQYKLTGGPGEKCIANGNTWQESEVKTQKKERRTK